MFSSSLDQEEYYERSGTALCAGRSDTTKEKTQQTAQLIAENGQLTDEVKADSVAGNQPTP